MKFVIAAPAIALGFIAGALGSPASAGPSRNTEPAATEQISYADLDLASAAGQRHLTDRIRFAAYRMCLVVSPATPSPAIVDPLCFRKAMAEGQSQMQRVIATAENHRVLAAASQQPR